MEKYVLKNFVLLNGHEDMKPEKDWNILVKNGKIECITKENITGYKEIDLDGQYLMPGLIDLHIHLPASGGAKSNANAKKLVQLIKKTWLIRKVGILICKKNAKDELLGGATTVRCVGGIGTLDTTIRDCINKGKYLGPRMYVANDAITVKGGHMEGTVSVAFDSEKEIENQILDLKNQGVDLIKLMITGGVLDAKKRGEPGDLKMPFNLVKAACDYAHQNGLKVAAHVEGPEGIHVAVEAGVDTIEHGSNILPEDLKEMKAKGLSLVTTISPALPLCKLSPDTFGVDECAQYNSEVLLGRMIECAKECMANGIPVGFGTDTGCPLIKHYNTYKEAVYAKDYLGFSNEKALYSLTLNNAKVIHIDDITGSIDAGKFADMLVLKNNPLEDLNALKDLSKIIIKGKIINKVRIKRDQKVEELLSSF